MSASALRCRWIYWKPWLWPRLCWERQRVVRKFSSEPADLWFTYHSYYKAPDLLGPYAAKRLNIPYVIFQGIYSTKRRRRLKTRAGFYLNKTALLAADHIFTNKKVDLFNLRRLLPDDRISYVAPGLNPDEFVFDAEARAELRQQWSSQTSLLGLSSILGKTGLFRPSNRRIYFHRRVRTARCGS